MKKLISKIILVVSVVSAIGLLFTGYAGWLNPNTWSWLSLAGYAFPAFLILTVASLVVCALIRKRYLLIPFLALVAAFPAVSLYCPVHLSGITSEPTMSDSTLTVLSYNSYNWARDNRGDYRNMHPNSIITYLATKDVDVICLQESPLCGYVNHEIDSLLRERYQYIDTVCGRGGSTVTVMSRHPVVRKQFIDYETSGNVSGAFWVNVRGTEVIIVNNHLQTMGFSMNERENFGEMVHGNMEEQSEIKNTSRTIVGKILAAGKMRSHQAEAVARFVRRHYKEPLLVCGDFNDIPQSYTYHAISTALDSTTAPEGLTDCFRNTAFGPCFTYSRFGIRARIDNILCSHHFTPKACMIDRSVTVSDHFPVIATLRIEN